MFKRAVNRPETGRHGPPTGVRTIPHPITIARVFASVPQAAIALFIAIATILPAGGHEPIQPPIDLTLQVRPSGRLFAPEYPFPRRFRSETYDLQVEPWDVTPLEDDPLDRLRRDFGPPSSRRPDPRWR